MRDGLRVPGGTESQGPEFPECLHPIDGTGSQDGPPFNHFQKVRPGNIDLPHGLEATGKWNMAARRIGTARPGVDHRLVPGGGLAEASFRLQATTKSFHEFTTSRIVFTGRRHGFGEGLDRFIRTTRRIIVQTGLYQ